jgi:ABC-type transporter Mla subunit MlaD
VGLFLLASAVVIALGLYYISRRGTAGELHYRVEFHESVLGLNVGSPVVYMGVPIGSVDDVDVHTARNHETNAEAYAPLASIVIKPNAFVLREGVKAKLSIYSIATGTLAITLEGGDPARPPLPEYSTLVAEKSMFEAVSSRVEEIMNNVQELTQDLDEVVEAFHSSLEGLEKGELAKIIKDTGEAVRETRDLAASVNETFGTIKNDAKDGVKDFRELVADVKELAQSTNDLVVSVEKKLEPINVAETQQKLNGVMDKIGSLAERLETFSVTLDKATQSVVNKTGGVEYNIREGIHSLSTTLDSLRELIEYLRQNPSALIRGKGTPTGEE